MPDDQAPPAETPQTPVNEALPESNVSTPSEPSSEPMPQAEANVPSEPAEPVSDAVGSATKPQSESSIPEPKLTPTPQPAVSTPTSINTPEHNRELLVIARAKLKIQKQRKLDAIMAVVERDGKITNGEVQALVHCSDATATRYLSFVVKQGKLKKVGTKGAGVVYVKV